MSMNINMKLAVMIFNHIKVDRQVSKLKHEVLNIINQLKITLVHLVYLKYQTKKNTMKVAMISIKFKKTHPTGSKIAHQIKFLYPKLSLCRILK